MFHSFTRIASLVLAFGFFISCSTLRSSKSEKTENPQDLSQSEIKHRLDSLNQQMASGQQSPELYYQKGRLLTELAQKQEHPTNRKSIYANAHTSLKTAENLYGDTPASQKEKVQQLLKVTWSNEHNQGVQIMQNDSTIESSDYLLAAAHFSNATTIIPDSSISYKMEARAYYKNQQPEKAISVLEEAQKNVTQMPASLLEELAYLYLENDQPQKAAKVYEQTKPIADQNLNLIHGLTNAYISSGEHQKAVELLQLLIEKEPENIIYHQTLASELYLLAVEKLKQVDSDLRSGKALSQTAFHTADSLLSQAENQFAKLIKESPEDLDVKKQFATFYQNGASKYQQIMPLADSNNKTVIEEKITQYLSSSIPLLKQLSEHDPDESVWRDLYQAYSYLGMKKEAQNAKSNF